MIIFKLVVLTLLATVVATEAVPRWSRRSRSYKPVEYKAPAPAYTDDYVKPVYTDDYAKTSYDYVRSIILIILLQFF